MSRCRDCLMVDNLLRLYDAGLLTMEEFVTKTMSYYWGGNSDSFKRIMEEVKEKYEI